MSERSLIEIMKMQIELLNKDIKFWKDTVKKSEQREAVWKKKYNLDETKIFKNQQLKELEDLKLRNQKRQGYTSLNIGMN